MQIGNPVPEANNNQSHRLTATIFLNKDWQVDSDGGELQLSPSTSTLATIPPVFDRVVFYPNHLVCPTILPATRDSISCSVVYKGWGSLFCPVFHLHLVIFSCFAIAALVQKNDQFILGEAVISNIIYVLHHHIYNITWLYYFQYNIPWVFHTIVAAQIYIMIQVYPVPTLLHYRIQALSIVHPSIDWYNGSYVQRGLTISLFKRSSV